MCAQPGIFQRFLPNMGSLVCYLHLLFYPVCRLIASAHPLESLYAFIAASLRSNISVLIVLKCNQCVYRGAANNLNLTEHLRLPSARPSSRFSKRNGYISLCAEDIVTWLQLLLQGHTGSDLRLDLARCKQAATNVFLKEKHRRVKLSGCPRCG